MARRLVPCLASALVFMALACEREDKPLHYSDHGTPIDGLPGALQMSDEFVESHEWLRPLEKPVWHGVAEADHMRADDPVIGVVLGEQVWAIPWWVMKNHHLANLTLGDQPVLMTFCEMCSGAAAFLTATEDGRRSFVRGGSYNGTFLIRDVATRSFWSPFGGNALTGELKGEKLERLPLYQAHWSEWQQLHPQSLVAWAPQSQREGHGHEQHPGAEGISNFFVVAMGDTDSRVPPHELVLGIELEGEALALPFSALDAAGPVSHHQVRGREVVVLRNPKSLMAGAYFPRSGGQPADLVVGQNGSIVDQQTGSRWEATGVASSGPRQGERLEFVPSGVEEWYVWSNYHPATRVFAAK